MLRRKILASKRKLDTNDKENMPPMWAAQPFISISECRTQTQNTGHWNGSKVIYFFNYIFSEVIISFHVCEELMGFNHPITSESPLGNMLPHKGILDLPMAHRNFI